MTNPEKAFADWQDENIGSLYPAASVFIAQAAFLAGHNSASEGNTRICDPDCRSCYPADTQEWESEFMACPAKTRESHIPFIRSLLHTQREETVAKLERMKRSRKPTHGTCCTCQTCGGSIADMDECDCRKNEWIDETIALLRNQQGENDRQNRENQRLNDRNQP